MRDKFFFFTKNFEEKKNCVTEERWGLGQKDSGGGGGMGAIRQIHLRREMQCEGEWGEAPFANTRHKHYPAKSV